MFSNKISVVIICKNGEDTIERTIGSALKVSDDVVVVDSGSTDGTIEKVRQTSAKLQQITWNGYGHAKNLGNNVALNNWVLSLDADEYLDNKLIASLATVDLTDATVLFTMQRLNYLGVKPIFFGEWRNDIVLRLFNKENATWNTAPVHEELIIKEASKKIRLTGKLHHYTSPDIITYRSKLKKYAELNSEKYFQKGKKAYWYKLYFSPVINFIQNYILKGGFLDGKEGLQIALAHAHYTYEKYQLLENKYTKQDLN